MILDSITLRTDRTELGLLTLFFSRSVVIALLRLIILFNENLDDITCESLVRLIRRVPNTPGISR